MQYAVCRSGLRLVFSRCMWRKAHGSVWTRFWGVIIRMWNMTIAVYCVGMAAWFVRQLACVIRSWWCRQHVTWYRPHCNQSIYLRQLLACGVTSVPIRLPVSLSFLTVAQFWCLYRLRRHNPEVLWDWLYERMPNSSRRCFMELHVSGFRQVLRPPPQKK